MTITQSPETGSPSASQWEVLLTPWQMNTHPSLDAITRLMQREGLQTYAWRVKPNHRYPARSYNYRKILMVVEGTLDIILVDHQEAIRLKAGDRIEVPARVRHATLIGSQGAFCVEASVKAPKS
jgi:mannose-6-phosphate isomerase-like protein (cupin superfamily)